MDLGDILRPSAKRAAEKIARDAEKASAGINRFFAAIGLKRMTAEEKAAFDAAVAANKAAQEFALDQGERRLRLAGVVLVCESCGRDLVASYDLELNKYKVEFCCHCGSCDY